MKNKILEKVTSFYRQSSHYTYKTLEQNKMDYKEELDYVSEFFKIDSLESLFLLSIIANNSEFKLCNIEEIASQLDVSRFDILKNLEVLYSLESKNLIEISEPHEYPQKNRKYAYLGSYPIEIMNKNLVISKAIENQFFK
ncbi:MAG: hypothetical protein I8H68_09905 [Flavobacteriia bacterium]|nr:hypothetical protein [Flavobacteriia bacterium]MBH2024932.1 hypothetical protein [Flavobacteriales bacterium]